MFNCGRFTTSNDCAVCAERVPGTVDYAPLRRLSRTRVTLWYFSTYSVRRATAFAQAHDCCDEYWRECACSSRNLFVKKKNKLYIFVNRLSPFAPQLLLLRIDRLYVGQELIAKCAEQSELARMAGWRQLRNEVVPVVGCLADQVPSSSTARRLSRFLGGRSQYFVHSDRRLIFAIQTCAVETPIGGTARVLAKWIDAQTLRRELGKDRRHVFGVQTNVAEALQNAHFGVGRQGLEWDVLFVGILVFECLQQWRDAINNSLNNILYIYIYIELQ